MKYVVFRRTDDPYSPDIYYEGVVESLEEVKEKIQESERPDIERIIIKTLDNTSIRVIFLFVDDKMWYKEIFSIEPIYEFKGL